MPKTKAEKAQYHKELRRKHIAQGLCVNCCKPRGQDGTKTMCRPCADKTSAATTAISRRYRAEHRCVHCGIPLPQNSTKSDCSHCLQKAAARFRKRRADNIAAGTCADCDKEPITQDGRYPRCEEHWLRWIAYDRLGDSKAYVFLKELFGKQNGLCPYTGDPLYFGDNASLDHIMPVSRFPELKENRDNVQWVSRSANWLKNDMTHNEFVEFIGKVYHYTHRS